MRIIAGQFRSRQLIAPRGLDTRPTSDRLRETLFNVLAPRIADSIFLDLYSGSGAVGIEALSRGAQEAIFVEKAEPALHAIRSNLSSLKIRAGYALEPHSAATALKRLTAALRTVDIVFLDPPYADATEYESTLNLLGSDCKPLLAPAAIIVAEHLKKLDLAANYTALTRYRTLKQGDSMLSFYSLSLAKTED
ncbi:MAG: 16S rRNA (guanine(966)-N(2))-methyltransferase RsmD [Silvibacterium sp.]